MIMDPRKVVAIGLLAGLAVVASSIMILASSGCDRMDCCQAHRPCGAATPEWCPFPVGHTPDAGVPGDDDGSGVCPDKPGDPGDLPKDGGSVATDGGLNSIDASDSGAPDTEYEECQNVGCCVSRCVKWHRNWTGAECARFCKEEIRD